MLMNLEESILKEQYWVGFWDLLLRYLIPKTNQYSYRQRKLIESNLIDNNTRLILSKSRIPVGILIDKDLSSTDNIFIPIFNEKMNS